MERLTTLMKEKVLSGKVESYYESGREMLDELLDEHSTSLSRDQKKLLLLHLQMTEEEQAGSILNMSNLVGFNPIAEEF